MNISNLQLNHTYKNYKQLCEVLEVPTKTGNAKKAQLKEFERYFKYDKKGYKFIVTHIYEIPLPENNNKTKYISTIEKHILDKLVHDPNISNGVMFISKSKLLEELRMINNNYTYGKYKQLRLSQHMEITIEEIEEFYLTSDDLLKRNIEAALNNLRNKSLIFWSHAITLCFIESDISINNNYDYKLNKHEKYNEYGEEEVSFSVNPITKRIHRKATESEVKFILRVEADILEKYNCESAGDVFKKGISKQYYKEVRDILFDKLNIFFYYNSYEIVCNEDHIVNKWGELEKLELNDLQRELSLNELNSDVMNRIKENATKRKQRAENEHIKGNENNKINMRMNSNYEANSFKLADTLISKDALSIKKTLENLKK